MVYGGLAAAGRVLPWAGVHAEWMTLLAGSIIALLWYGQRRFRWLPSPRQQMRKPIAEYGLRGAAIYGFIIGIGLLTIVVSPLVWIGAAAVVFSGSWSWGATYGVSFGSARILHFLRQYQLGIPDDPSEVPLRVIRARESWVPPLGVAGALCIGVLAAIGLY